MPIVWTDKARAHLPKRTRESVPAFKPGDAKAIWAAVRQSLQPRPNNKYDPFEGAFVKGRSLTTPDLAALMEKCARIASSDDIPVFDDVDVAAAMAVTVGKIAYGRSLALLLATMPLPRAFEAHLRSRDFGITPNYARVDDPFRIVPAAPDADVVDVDWRATLLAQSDAIRAECKEIARRIWPSANLGKRTTLAYAFFEEAAWCDDVCRAWLAKGQKRHVPLNDIVVDFALAQSLVRDKNGSWNYFPLVERFGERMLPVLVELANAPFDRWHAREVAEVLALFDDPDAANAMVKMLTQASSRPHALDYFARYPKHAEAALATVSSMKGRAAKVAREVLTGAARAATSAVKPEDEAPLEALPRVLARPPWLDEEKPKKPATKLELEPIATEEVVDWPPGARERGLKLYAKTTKQASPETIAEYQEAREAGKYVTFAVMKGELLPDAVILESWNAGQKAYGGTLGQRLEFALAKFGDAALPGLSHFVEHLATGWGEAPLLLSIRSWRLALPMARHVAHRKIGKVAWQWLQRHAEIAVLALVPVAFGDDKTAREHAERGLFRLQAAGVDVVGIGARYGAPAKKALEKLFAWDPLYDLPKKMPAPAAAWRAETLLRPRLLDGGKALPLAALETLGTMLAFSPIDPPYPGILQVKEACEPRSLAEFSWETARAWEHAGHKKKDDWMLMSLVHFADDEVVRRLTPGVRADFAVRVLEAIGTDAALMEMATIAGRTQSTGGEWTLAGKIEKLLGEAAAERGVSKDELEEDLAPTTELDDSGLLVLDYGPRKIEVGFDECLVPYVRSASGGRSKALPPPRKDDDPEKMERAKTIWRDLKEDVTVIAARRIRALERGMTTRRTWTMERFRRVWIDHRLMRHLARGVVWTDGKTPFRVAEDGTPSRVDDTPHTLAENAKIGVAHPLDLPKDELEKWRTLFDDYAIAQPFQQLGRQYLPLDAAATRIPWPYAALSGSDMMTRLLARGYQRGPWEQGKQSYKRELHGGAGHIRVEFKSLRGGVLEDTAVVFLRDDKEAAASAFDSVLLADAIYELQS